jgi:hypothetical protein
VNFLVYIESEDFEHEVVTVPQLEQILESLLKDASGIFKSVSVLALED